MAEKPRKRVWVKTVDVTATELETRLAVAAARGLGPDQKAAADGARALLAKARDAANRIDPRPSRWAIWWKGATADPAFQNLHAAMAQMVDVYDDADLLGEIQTAAARQHVTTDRDDSRRIDPVALASQPIEQQRAVLRRTIADSYATMDSRYEQIRSFRNIILLAAAVLTVLLGVTLAFVASSPKILPLCFGDGTAASPLNCPSASGVTGPRSADVLLVGLLGALGGALAASLSIRKLQGTSVPYDIPAALAVFKLPLGALTAILGLVAIRAAIIPGLSALDSQSLIVAYALILGIAQQSVTTLLDSRAQDLLGSLPATSGPAPGTPPPAAVVAPVPRLGAGAAPSIVDPAAGSAVPAQRVELSGYLPEPSGHIDAEIPTEDGSPVMPDVIEMANS